MYAGRCGVKPSLITCGVVCESSMKGGGKNSKTRERERKRERERG